MNHHLTARFAAAGHRCQDEALRMADAAADQIDATVAYLWRQLLATIKRNAWDAQAHTHSTYVLGLIGVDIADTLDFQLRSLAKWGARRAASHAARTLPLRYLQAAALRQPMRLQEAELSLSDLLAPLRQPSPLDADTQRSVLAQLLFPPPPEELLARWLAPLVQPHDWLRIGTDNDKRLPQDLAAQIASDKALGKSQREIAAGIRPYLDGSRMRARRAARTFGVLLAHKGQEHTWAQLGDLVIGFTLHTTHTPDTRPWHQARNGRQYFKTPGPGQDGLEKCPHPPLEPADPSERPPRTPQVAFNCLCFLTPILRAATAPVSV